MKLLLLAFEPAGSLRFDPSGQVAKELCKRLVGNIEGTAALIPAVFSRCWEAAGQAIMEARPQAVLALAQRGSVQGVTFERVARNFIDAEIPDREGVQPRNAQIAEGGAEIYETALPLEQMVEEVCQKGIPAGISHDAGAFVCNYLYYHLLRAAEKGDFRTAFVHLPNLPGQDVRRGTAGMAFDDMVRGLEAALRALRASGGNPATAEKAP